MTGIFFRQPQLVSTDKGQAHYSNPKQNGSLNSSALKMNVERLAKKSLTDQENTKTNLFSRKFSHIFTYISRGKDSLKTSLEEKVIRPIAISVDRIRERCFRSSDFSLSKSLKLTQLSQKFSHVCTSISLRKDSLKTSLEEKVIKPIAISVDRIRAGYLHSSEFSLSKSLKLSQFSQKLSDLFTSSVCRKSCLTTSFTENPEKKIIKHVSVDEIRARYNLQKKTEKENPVPASSRSHTTILLISIAAIAFAGIAYAYQHELSSHTTTQNVLNALKEKAKALDACASELRKFGSSTDKCIELLKKTNT